MKNRLEEFLKLEGLTSVKFAEIMQIQPSSVSHILSGRNNPNFDFVSRMLQRFEDLNPDWLINGIGEVYRSNINEDTLDVTNVNSVNKEVEYVNSNTITEGKDRLEVNKQKDNSLFTNVNNDPLDQVKSSVINRAAVMDDNRSKTIIQQAQNTDNQGYNQRDNNHSPSILADLLESSAEVKPQAKNFPEKQNKQITKIVFFYSDSTCCVFEVE